MARLFAPSGDSLEIPDRRIRYGVSAACEIPLTADLGLEDVQFETAPMPDGGHALRHAGGAVATLVNGSPVHETVLRHGDIISAGKLQLAYWRPMAEPAPHPAPTVSPARGGVVLPPPGRISEPVAPIPLGMAAPLPPLAVTPPAPASPPPAAAAPPLAPSPPLPEPDPTPVPRPAPQTEASPPPPSRPYEPIREKEFFQPLAPEPPVSPPAAAAAEAPREPLLPAETVESTPALFTEAPAQDAPAPAPPPRRPLPVPPRRRRLRWSGAMTALVMLLSAGGGAAYYLRTPGGRAAAAPWIAKFREWAEPKPAAPPSGVSAPSPAAVPVPAPAAPGSGENSPAASPSPPPAAASAAAPKENEIVERTDHQDVVRSLLTARTRTLFYADLKQLVPYYNTLAASRNLPPQKEMTEALRRQYGAALDSFTQLSCLQGEGKEDFVFVFTAAEKFSLSDVLGRAGEPAPSGDGPPNSQKRGSQAKILSVRGGNRTFGAAQYDPFTLLLGQPKWIELALQRTDSPPLREAKVMFPQTAHRAPGALIIVERLTGGGETGDGNSVEVFETVVSNLFLPGKGDSTISLTRQPEAKEELFVQSAGGALREQAAAIAENVKKQGGALSSAPAAEPTISINEAGLALADGSALITTALESMARSIMEKRPSLSAILHAQEAAGLFNSARAAGSPEALAAASPAAALDLLIGGLRGAGGSSGAVFQLPAAAAGETDAMARLLALETGIGLVYRPDKSSLAGPALDLALAARDYRNAELLLMLWNQAKLKTGDNRDPAAAARSVMTWASSPEGAATRSMLGLPALTVEEFTGAAAHLEVSGGALVWKAGEPDYRAWVRKVNAAPDKKDTGAAAPASPESAGAPRKTKP